MVDKKENEGKHMESIVSNFFLGEINEDDVFPFPIFKSDDKELLNEIIPIIDKFADSVDSEKLDKEAKIPDEILKKLSEMGLYGLSVPDKYGGMDLNTSSYARVFSTLAEMDASIVTMLGAHQSIGFKALLNEGTEEQKKKWLPHLSSGEKIAAFCLTEPGSGSDAYSIKTKAIDNGDGTYSISGQKLWITNANLADFYSVFCKTQHDVNGEIKEKITCFIVEKGMEGLSFGEKEDKMGIRASETRAVFFDNVRVPKENILGELGRGFKVAMNVLNNGRLSLGSACIGCMKSLLSLATNHAKERKQFGKSICEFEMIQDKLVNMAAHIYATESIAYMTTGNIDRGLEDYSLESAICKVYSSEALWKIADSSLQIAAGIGYMKEYPYERLMRDSRINLIFEGTNEILRCFIALSGVRKPSEKLREIGKISDVSSALSNPIKSLGIFSEFAFKRISRIISSTSLSKVDSQLIDLAGKFSSMLSGFSLKVENVLINHGKKIVDREIIQENIADMAINLYVMISVLSRTTFILKSKNFSDDTKEYCLQLNNYAFKNARRDFIKAFKEINKKKHKTITDVSNTICKMNGYGIDILEL